MRHARPSTATTRGMQPDLDANTTWRKLAACRRVDAERFFPIGGGPLFKYQERQALRVCQPCPVRHQCFQWAVKHGVTDGIWGMPQQQLRDMVAKLGTTRHIENRDTGRQRKPVTPC